MDMKCLHIFFTFTKFIKRAELNPPVCRFGPTNLMFDTPDLDLQSTNQNREAVEAPGLQKTPSSPPFLSPSSPNWCSPLCSLNVPPPPLGTSLWIKAVKKKKTVLMTAKKDEFTTCKNIILFM